MKLKPNQYMLGDHLITERPILFQTEMVQAILEDRKTQTRRILKSIRPVEEFEVVHKVAENDFWIGVLKGHFMGHSSTRMKSPYGQPGDLLWVKETHQFGNGKVYFKANLTEQVANEVSSLGAKWKPSIHMPKYASRIWLMVEDVRVERLQDITEEDAIAEGVDNWTWKDMATPQNWKDYTDPFNPPLLCATDSFESLWISINGEESLESNPWVWVVKFRVLSNTGRPSHDAILASRISVLGSQERKDVSHV
jgi:hypothetical protein